MYIEVPVFQLFSYTLCTFMDFTLYFIMSQDIILSIAPVP